MFSINLKLNIFNRDYSILLNELNKALTNGLMIIHPIILYSSYALLFVIIFLKIFYKNKFIFFTKYFFFYKTIYYINIILFLISIFLGS